MKGSIVNRNGIWKIQGGDGKDIPLHPDDNSRVFKPGQTVDFDIVPLQKKQMREFAGSFSITYENVAKIRENN